MHAADRASHAIARQGFEWILSPRLTSCVHRLNQHHAFSTRALSCLARFIGSSDCASVVLLQSIAADCPILSGACTSPCLPSNCSHDFYCNSLRARSTYSNYESKRLGFWNPEADWTSLDSKDDDEGNTRTDTATTVSEVKSVETVASGNAAIADAKTDKPAPSANGSVSHALQSQSTVSASSSASADVDANADESSEISDAKKRAKNQKKRDKQKQKKQEERLQQIRSQKLAALGTANAASCS